ncbi:thermonuclease family protein [Staphylococcus agnetis]|uniref:thermonuclease family protein n=1 Tax=Staphylococcus agnetis TaxID=985762 RepID=UPI00208E9EB6|nr:thermonuclease family protein [Staphylococcus agnetis]MCO4326135.1 thermonuclease family protein [Staphylococcus agnetis]MCO4356969.1 thermonuclease family protein [Staphylococcus agnetis]
MTLNNKLYIFKAKVLRVVDGDTLEMRIDLGFHTHTVRKVRLLGVDTPERGQVNYNEAKAFTTSTVLGKDVYVQTYQADAFGRYLGDVWYQEGGNEFRLSHELSNRGLVKQGSEWNEEDE